MSLGRISITSTDNISNSLDILSKKVNEILQIPPGNRSNEDLLTVVKWITRSERINQPIDHRVFTRTPLDILINMSQYVILNSYSNGELIFLQKEAGVTYFIVLNGSVDIYDTDVSRVIPEDIYQQYIDIKFQNELNGGTKIPELNPEAPSRILGSIVQKSKYLTTIASGCSLGEIALVSTEGIRTASAVASQPTQLIAIHKTIYDPLIKKYNSMNVEYEERMKFCSKIDVLSDWNKDKLYHIAYWIEESIYPKGTYIISQSKPYIDKIDIIKEGEVEVICRYPGLDTVELAIRGRGSIIGESCVLNEKNVNFSVIAKSDVITYCIKEQHIKKFLKICKGTNTIPKLHKLYTDRETFRQNRLAHFQANAGLVNSLLHPSQKRNKPIRLIPLKHNTLSPTEKILCVLYTILIEFTF